MSETSEDNKRQATPSTTSEILDESLEPLGDNILVNNFGIPITVVVTKVSLNHCMIIVLTSFFSYIFSLIFYLIVC